MTGWKPQGCYGVDEFAPADMDMVAFELLTLVPSVPVCRTCLIEVPVAEPCPCCGLVQVTA